MNDYKVILFLVIVALVVWRFLTTKKSQSNTLSLLFASVGCCVAVVLLFEHIHPTADVGCSAVGGNCLGAIESRYGHVGPIPTSVLGLLMYVSLVALCLKRRMLIAEQSPSLTALDLIPDLDLETSSLDPGANVAVERHEIPPPAPTPFITPLRVVNLLVWLIAAPAVCISIWLQKVSLYSLMSFCPWCMTSAFLVTCIFLLASKDLFLEDRKLVGEQGLLVGTIGFIAFMGGLMVIPDVLNQINGIRAMTPKPIPPGWVKPLPPGQDTSPVVIKDMNATGPATAPFTIVEFADYECPHCQKASVALDNYLQSHPGKYRLAFRNCPLPIHKWANQAAFAAEAAAMQGKFWEMHDYIFAHQDEMKTPAFGQDTFKEYASALGLDVAKFEKDEMSDKVIMRVATDTTTAQKQGVQQTPSFFIVNKAGRMYRLSGLDQMKAAFNNPDNEVWK